MLDRCRRADSFFRPPSPTASRPISLREIFSAADGSEGVSDLPNMGMADAPHEPALILYLPDKPLRALVADASLDASPQARRHTPPHAAARAARAARRHLLAQSSPQPCPRSAPTLFLPAAARRSGTPSLSLTLTLSNPNPNPNQERHALTELLHSMLVLEPEKRCSAASALLSLSPLYSRAVGDRV